VAAQSSQLVQAEASPAKPIRLLLDGRKLGDGGIGVYTENLIKGLLSVGGVDLSVIIREPSQQSSGLSSNVTWIEDPARPYSLDELVNLPRRVSINQFDVFHAPHYVLPYRVSIPSVVTVHDLIHISHPEKFYYPWIARRLITSAVKRASAVITVSRHTRRELLTLAKVDESKVRFIPNAIAPALTEAVLARDGSERRKPYFFSLFSNNKPHKGLKDLLAAYAMYREGATWRRAFEVCPQLVLAGYGTQEMEKLLLAEGSANLLRGVTVVGALPTQKLQQYLTHALALVVPSLIEGFCLPAIEAQAVGTPVVSRPVPALSELVTDQDIIARDFSVASLAQAMASGAERGMSDARGVNKAHLATYSCASVAAQVKLAYESVLSPRNRA
jgi:glycosyltransferase involved in cell wall biosynthesis